MAHVARQDNRSPYREMLRRPHREMLRRPPASHLLKSSFVSWKCSTACKKLQKEFAEDGSTPGKLMTGIRVGSRTLFEMKDSINRLGMIKVDARWAEFRDMLKLLHQQRIEIVQEMNQMSKTLLAGPEPGINYGKLTARAPELTAQTEELDKSIFTMAQAIFFALVDNARVGADGKMHHLLLTKKDRTSMVQLIDKIFGSILEDKNASRIVSSAWVIKYGLTRPHYKAADEL
jgi:hypothetical protein